MTEMKKLAEQTGLLECIDDAYQARGDWLTLVQKFADAVRAEERERCARICDTTPPYPFRPSIEAAHAIRATPSGETPP